MLLVDSADHTQIRNALAMRGVKGVTTNPTLMTRASSVETLSISDYVKQGQALCHLSCEAGIGQFDELMIQGVGSRQDILDQAKLYRTALNGSKRRLWIKLVPTEESMSLCGILHDMGVYSLITAVFTATQLHVAMEAGADGVAVYVGRLKRLDKEWTPQLDAITKTMAHYKKLLLLASFPDRETVEMALSYSRDMTVPPDILKLLLNSPYTDQAIRAFDNTITP